MENEMRIMGISPGPDTCGFVVVDKSGNFLRGESLPIGYLIEDVLPSVNVVAIELLIPPWYIYEDALAETSLAAGRLWQAALDRNLRVYRISRNDCVRTACNKHAGWEAMSQMLQRRCVSKEQCRTNTGIKIAFTVALYASEIEAKFEAVSRYAQTYTME